MPPSPRLPFVFLAFAVVGLLSAAAELVTIIAAGRDVSPLRTIIHAQGIWLLFAALSPIGLWTARRFPLHRDRLARSTPAHALALTAMSLSHTLVYTTTVVLVSGGAIPDAVATIGSTWIGNMRADVFVYAMLVGGYYVYAASQGARVVPASGEHSATPAGETPRPWPERISVKDRGRITFVDVSRIESLEADGDYVRVRSDGRSYLVRATLGAMERELDPRQFVRIHRSTIVGVRHIVELEPREHGEFFLSTTSGARLKVSRSYRAAAKQVSDRLTASPLSRSRTLVE